MSRIQFNHVFVSLIALAALSAFVIDPKYTNRARNVQALFAPVAAPTRRIGAALRERYSKPTDDGDRRAVADIKTENQTLRTLVLTLNGQLQELKRITAERRQMGDVGALSTRVPVVGTDSGTRESLSLQGTMEPLASGMPVVTAVGLVGRINRGGAAGATVQLVTDKSFRVRARFMSQQTETAIQASAKVRTPAVLEGAGVEVSSGRSFMIVKSYVAREAESVQIGDEVVLDDLEWPSILKDERIGQVVSKTARRDSPQFVEIRVAPVQDLKNLRDVMVVTKGEYLPLSSDHAKAN